ncbi:hypothetical protein ACP275_07G036900 [Erythranthe tilingii]
MLQQSTSLQFFLISIFTQHLYSLTPNIPPPILHLSSVNRSGYRWQDSFSHDEIRLFFTQIWSLTASSVHRRPAYSTIYTLF